MCTAGIFLSIDEIFIYTDSSKKMLIVLKFTCHQNTSKGVATISVIQSPVLVWNLRVFFLSPLPLPHSINHILHSDSYVSGSISSFSTPVAWFQFPIPKLPLQINFLQKVLYLWDDLEKKLWMLFLIPMSSYLKFSEHRKKELCCNSLPH